MRRLLTVFLLLFCCQALAIEPTAAPAAPALYQIDLIIFPHVTAANLASEYWPLLPPILYKKQAIRLSAINNYTDRSDDLIVPQPTALTSKMSRINKRLQKRQSSSPILAVSWQQPLTRLSQAPWVQIQGGAQYSLLTPTSPRLDQSPQEQAASQTIHELWGYVRVSVQRYISVNLDLLFTQPTSSLKKITHQERFKNMSQPFFSFELKDTRRMRSEELNYIDHPLFGALIYITPMKTAQVIRSNTTSHI